MILDCLISIDVARLLVHIFLTVKHVARPLGTRFLNRDGRWSTFPTRLHNREAPCANSEARESGKGVGRRLRHLLWIQTQRMLHDLWGSFF